MIFPEIHAKIPKVRVIITEEPVAKPSIPSLKFAPFETALIIKMTKKTKTTILYSLDLPPVQEIKYE
jgi:hypothetical protein